LDEHKQKLDQEKDAFDIDMKIKKLQLQKLEGDPNIDPQMAASQKEMFMAESKLKKSMYEYKTKEIATALNEVNQEGQQYAGQIQTQASFLDGFDLGKSGLGLFKPMSDTDRYRQRLNAAKSGQLPWEELDRLYPDKIEKHKEFKKQTIPIEKSPEFEEGTGGLISKVGSKLSPNQAEISPETKRVISNIKTEADWEEFLKDVGSYSEAGVDVEAIKEYFGRKI
jgi:hypothetical protein